MNRPIHQPIAELHRQFEGLLRFGVVHAVNLEKMPLYRIKDGDFISGWLPQLVARSLPDQQQWLLTVGEPVAALLTGDGRGLILGAVYQAKPNPAPKPNAYRLLLDGGRDGLDYDPDSKTITLQADTLIFKAGKVSFKRR